MTLDEAIKHCKEKAEEIRKANEEMPIECKLSEELCKCAEEHEQLAEWLIELKAYKACPLMQDECYFCNADKCHNGGQK